jgi:hypothetical protein
MRAERDLSVSRSIATVLIDGVGCPASEYWEIHDFVETGYVTRGKEND